MKYLATFKVPVTYSLLFSQKQEANRLINLKFIGRERFKNLEETASKEHQDAAFALNGHYQVQLEVGLREDGVLEVIDVARR